MGKDSRSRKQDRGGKPELNPEQQALMKLASELRGSKGIEHRTSVLEEMRVEYFRGKDFVRWLQDHADKVRDLPLATAQGGARSLEERVFERMLAYSYLIQTDRVNKKIPKGRKKLPKWPNRDGLQHLPLRESKLFNEDTFYIWTFEQPTATWKTVLIVCGLPLLTIGCCLFPLSPVWMRLCVLYLCMALLGVMLGVVAVRFVAHLLVWIVLGKNFWILPNLLSEEVAMTDAFRPLWGFHESSSSSNAAASSKGASGKAKAKDSTPSKSGGAITAAGGVSEEGADGSTSAKGDDTGDEKESEGERTPGGDRSAGDRVLEKSLDKPSRAPSGAKAKEGRSAGRPGGSAKVEDTGSFLPSPSLVNRLAVLAALVAIGYAVVRHGPDGNQVRQMRSRVSNSVLAFLEWKPGVAISEGGGGKAEPPGVNATMGSGGASEGGLSEGVEPGSSGTEGDLGLDGEVGMDGDPLVGPEEEELNAEFGSDVEGRSGDGKAGEGRCEQGGSGDGGSCGGGAVGGG
eukprot:jgi/Mesvir1/27366/Mv07176-RA.1